MNIELFCEKFNLGKVKNITKLTGGLMHKMFKVQTDINTYAVKILNPEIMKRNDAMDNFILSEKISNLAFENNIPVSNSLIIEGNFINKLNDTYYMVFKYIDGKTLKDDEITIEHCKKIGEVLSKMHSLDFSKLNITIKNKEDHFYVNWDEFIKNNNFNSMPYKDLYLKNYEKYYSILERVVERFNLSNKYFGVCHMDLDPKNVMWENDNPIIIDFESASISNTKRELVETALNWSGFLSGNFDIKKFETLLKSYLKTNSFDHDRYFVICGNLIGRFGWLDYNLKRSLGIIKTDDEEKQIAIKEVSKTINEINDYLDLVGVMYESLCNLTKKDNHDFDNIIKKIVDNNDLFKNKTYKLINRGFTNKIYEVDKYIVRICINKDNEERFLNEIEFYNLNKDNKNIPKLYLSDTSKKIVPYYYQIQEKIEGKTLYEIWHKITEEERKEIVHKISIALKDIHKKNVNEYDFKTYLKNKFNALDIKDLDKENLFKLIDIYFKNNNFGLIHGDLHFDNIIINNGDIKILDFERSMIAPIDMDFSILNMCKKKPYLWASADTDMLQVGIYYENVINYFKEYYEDLNNIKYLYERLEVYGLIEKLKDYKRTKNKKELDNINRLIKEGGKNERNDC